VRVFDQRVDHGLCVLAADPYEHDVARVTLHERGNLAVMAPHQQITFPVAGHGPVFDLSRAFADGYHAGELAMIGRLLSVVARTSHGACASEMHQKLLFQGTTGLDEEAAIDGLM